MGREEWEENSDSEFEIRGRLKGGYEEEEKVGGGGDLD